MHIKSIETERLIIRRFEPEDWEAVHTYTGDAVVMTWVEEGQVSEDQKGAYIAANTTDEALAFPDFFRTRNTGLSAT